MSDDDRLKRDQDDGDDEFKLEPLDLDALDDEIEFVDDEPEPEFIEPDDEPELDPDTEVSVEDDTAAANPTDEIEPIVELAVESATERSAEPPVEPTEEPALAPVNLDVLDDEIEPVTVELDDKAEEMLDTIQTLDDEIEPAAVAIPAVEPVVEPAEEAASEPLAAEPEPEPAEPVIPETRYRVLIPLPADMSEQVVSLRKTGQIKGAPPPGVELGFTFRTADLETVQNALSRWASSHLPLQLEITGIQAEVVGAQQYVAAWYLQPQKELKKAHDDLVKRLNKLTLTIAAEEVAPVSSVRVMIGDHIAPRPYPRVIAQMQQDFEPYVWHAESVTLVKIEPNAHKWEAAGSFQ